MSGSLTNYVLQQLAQGYTLDQIKAYLTSYNYAPADIELGIKEAIQTQALNLHSYIEQLLTQKYQLPQIRQYLLQYHYD